MRQSLREEIRELHRTYKDLSKRVKEHKNCSLDLTKEQSAIENKENTNILNKLPNNYYKVKIQSLRTALHNMELHNKSVQFNKSKEIIPEETKVQSNLIELSIVSDKVLDDTKDKDHSNNNVATKRVKKKSLKVIEGPKNSKADKQRTTLSRAKSSISSSMNSKSEIKSDSKRALQNYFTKQKRLLRRNSSRRPCNKCFHQLHCGLSSVQCSFHR